LLTFHLIHFNLAHFSNKFRVDLLLQITNINRRLGSILDSLFEFFITNCIEIGDIVIFSVLKKKQSDDLLMLYDLLSCAVFINLETLEMAVDEVVIIVEEVDSFFLVFYLFLESLNVDCEFAEIQYLFVHHLCSPLCTSFSVCR
jgi:hypothetical protein